MSDKSVMVCVRVAPAYRARLDRAARRVGQNTADFVRSSLDRSIDEAEAKDPVQSQMGFPSYFAARCQEAARGGSGGYAAAGYCLANHIADEQPRDLDDEEWEQEQANLHQLVFPTDPRSPNRPAPHLRDDEEVLFWFLDTYPKMMKLVPRRRHTQFLQGIYRACDEGTIKLTRKPSGNSH